LEEKVEILNVLLKELPEERKQSVDKLLESDYGARYFNTPASSKADRHSCFEGGLFVHSITVTKLLLAQNKAMKAGISTDSCIIAGLFHDLGKCGNMAEPFYVVQQDNWRRNNLGEYYKYNEKLNDSLTVPQRSLRMLQNFDVKITDSEYIAILYHDGLYVPENNHNSLKNSKDKLARLLHFCDSWSCFIDNV